MVSRHDSAIAEPLDTWCHDDLRGTNVRKIEKIENVSLREEVTYIYKQYMSHKIHRPALN